MLDLKQIRELLAAGRAAEARVQLEAIAGDPTHDGQLKAMLLLGDLLVRQGEVQPGLDLFQAMPSEGELGEAAALIAGNSCIDSERYEDAATWLRQAIAIRPSAPAWCLLHSALFRSGASDEESLDCLLQALRVEPSYEEAHANLAMRYRLEGRPKLARAHADRALELDPHYAFALTEACALAVRSDPREAIELGRRATREDPNSFWSWVYLAIAHWAVGEMEDADACYRKARSARPGDEWSMRLHAEFIRKALGDDEASRRLMEVAIALAPDSDEALQAWGTSQGDS